MAVSRTRLAAAHSRLVAHEAASGHRGLQKNRLVRNGLVPVKRANLKDYPENEEAADLQVCTVDKRGQMHIGEGLFYKWVSGGTPMQLNAMLEMRLRGMLDGAGRSARE